jgi:hypothetical protein
MNQKTAVAVRYRSPVSIVARSYWSSNLKSKLNLTSVVIKSEITIQLRIWLLESFTGVYHKTSMAIVADFSKRNSISVGLMSL